MRLNPSVRRAIETMITIHDFGAWEDDFVEVDDIEALTLDTVSMRAIRKVGRLQKVEAFFGGTFLFLMSALFLGTLIWGVITFENLTYKSAFILVLFVSCSYIMSWQMKRIDQARQKRMLTVAQLVRKQFLSDGDDGMKHMKIIKQDTKGYLRAIKKKTYKKRKRNFS
jgi:hypothetical protein